MVNISGVQVLNRNSSGAKVGESALLKVLNLPFFKSVGIKIKRSCASLLMFHVEH